MANGYLIRIPKREDLIRAIPVMMKVQRTRYGFTDHRYLVTPEHVEALRAAGIPFEDLTDLPPSESTSKKKKTKKPQRRKSA